MARWNKTLDLSDWWEGLPLDFLVTPMEDFDYAMSELYDWADRHGLWVKTVF